MTRPKPAMRDPALATQIKERLVDRIVEGDLQPGDRLIEMAIAKAMGTSQAPVREALKELEGLGLVQFRRNRGAIVRKMTAAELVDVYAVRAELEGYAATIASGKPKVGVRLLALCAKMDEKCDDRAAFVALNTKFHRMIVEASGNQTLIELWERLDIRTRTALNTADQIKAPHSVLSMHRQIAEAIQSGNSTLARQRLVAHINGVVD